MRLIICFFITGFLSYCSHAGDQSANAIPESTESFADRSFESEDQFASNEQPATSDPVPEQLETERKIIRTADIHMEVKDVKKASQDMRQLIAEYEAQVTSESEQRWDYRVENQFVIRIKPEKLDDFIASTEKLALRMTNKSVYARDVTREYIDLETRLSSKREIVERYRAILKTAKSIPDILEIEEKLRVVIEEIESTEGQLRYLKNQVQLSTVNLTMYESIHQPLSKGRGFLSRMGSALRTGWEVLQELIIGIISIWPIVIIIGLGIFYFIRRRRRKKKE